MKTLITSKDNPFIAYLKSLRDDASSRRREKAFITEGTSLVGEAVASGMALRLVVSKGQEGRDEVRQIVRQGEGMRVEVVVLSDSLMKSVSSLTTSPGVMAVVKMPEWKESEVLERRRPILLLCGLQDPGNMGTIIRTAEAAGAGGIFCTFDTVDPYNPKVVRGSMGSILRVPVMVVDDAATLLDRASRAGYETLAAGMRRANVYFDEDLKRPFLLLVGQEAGGLPPELAEEAHRTISIPMEGKAESLNAAMASGIILFEAKRQRTETR